MSLGLLMLVWGADKLVNPSHGMQVAEHFYFGLPAPRALLPLAGIAQIALGVLVIVGRWRRVAFGALAAVTGLTLLGVWRSIVDPWGWVLSGTQALFFPSLIVFAGVLVLLAFERSDADSAATDEGDRRPVRTGVPGTLERWRGYVGRSTPSPTRNARS